MDSLNKCFTPWQISQISQISFFELVFCLNKTILQLEIWTFWSLVSATEKVVTCCRRPHVLGDGQQVPSGLRVDAVSFGANHAVLVNINSAKYHQHIPIYRYIYMIINGSHIFISLIFSCSPCFPYLECPMFADGHIGPDFWTLNLGTWRINTLW